MCKISCIRSDFAGITVLTYAKIGCTMGKPEYRVFLVHIVCTMVKKKVKTLGSTSIIMNITFHR